MDSVLKSSSGGHSKMSPIGANLDFRKYFEKYAGLAREQKFPEIYLTRHRILLRYLLVSRVPNLNAGGAKRNAVFFLAKGYFWSKIDSKGDLPPRTWIMTWMKTSYREKSAPFCDKLGEEISFTSHGESGMEAKKFLANLPWWRTK